MRVSVSVKEVFEEQRGARAGRSRMRARCFGNIRGVWVAENEQGG